MHLKSTYLCQRGNFLESSFLLCATLSKSEPLPSGRCIVTLLSCKYTILSAFLRVLNVRQAASIAILPLRGSSRQWWWCWWCWCSLCLCLVGLLLLSVVVAATAAVACLGCCSLAAKQLPPDEENSPLSHGTNGVVMRRLHVRSPHPPHTCLKVFTTSVT